MNIASVYPKEGCLAGKSLPSSNVSFNAKHKLSTTAQQTDGMSAGGRYGQTVAPFDIDIQAVYQSGIQAVYQLELFSIPKRLFYFKTSSLQET